MHHRRRTAVNPFLQFFGLLVVSVALVFPAAHAAERKKASVKKPQAQWVRDKR
mgnify:FL=1